MRAVLYLATSPLATNSEIARAQEIPHEYLIKIIQSLAEAGIVSTRRGAGGGITLARAPEKITLLDVIEAVSGPLAINRCFSRPGECSRESFCAIHEELAGVQEEIAAALSRTDFARLARAESAAVKGAG
jgi:Rrf2 family protein